MSFVNPAEKELEGQKGSVGHFWNQETEDSASYFSKIDQTLMNNHKMCWYNSSGSGHNKVSKLDALLEFWEQFEALWGFIRVTSR